jgi:hypothetical protein
MIPLHGGQQNEIRFEVVVTAFSSGVSVKSGERWTAVAGDLPPLEVQDRVRNEFAVVFRAQIES